MENSNSLIYQNVKEYFSNINPIAKKISNEIEQIQSVYGDLWFTFSDKEKSDIINDTLICPDISLLYYNLTSPLVTRKYFSDSSNSQISQLEVAGQVQGTTNANNDVKSSTYDGQSLDCVHNLFRDEHSSPFSYRTKSQIDLSNCELVPYAASKTHRSSEEKSSILNKMQLPRVTAGNSEKINDEANQNQKHQFKTKSNSMLSNIKFLRQKVSTAIEKESPVVKTTNKDYYTKTKNPVAVSTSSCTEQNHKEIYEEDDEHSNLINNSIANESITSLTSSLATSDEETLTHNTEKTLCDKVALLEHDSNIRKGFDFLNNW